MGSSQSRRHQAARGAPGPRLPHGPADDSGRPNVPSNYPIPQRPRGQNVPEQTTTQTIRNNVNLKKKSLRLVPDEIDKGVLKVAFTLDAAVPCKIGIFFAATESVREHCRIETKASLPAGTMSFFGKGLGQTFVQKVEDGLIPGKYDPSELTSFTHEEFPLIVRLETYGEGDGCSSASEQVGEALRPDIQAQTTYARLVKDEDEGYSVRVLKQKIWVNGTTYELQEIFGIENSKAITGSGVDDTGKECVICMTEPRTTTVLPCRHMCLCRDCANVLRHQSNKCPICRTTVSSLLEIRVEGQGSQSALQT